MNNESMVTQAKKRFHVEGQTSTLGARWQIWDGEQHFARFQNIADRDDADKLCDALNEGHRTAAQPEREAVLGLEWSEDGYSLRTPYDGDVNDDTGQHIVVGGETVVTFSDSDEGDRAREWFQVALTTPAPAADASAILNDICNQSAEALKPLGESK